jgi:hypothetical protein
MPTNAATQQASHGSKTVKYFSLNKEGNTKPNKQLNKTKQHGSQYPPNMTTNAATHRWRE